MPLDEFPESRLLGAPAASARAADARTRAARQLAGMALAFTLGGSTGLLLLRQLPHVPSQGEQAVAALGAHTEVLALGASHVFADIDPARTGMRWMNLSAGLMNYTFMEAVLAAHEAKLTGLRTLVLDLDPVPVFTDSYASSRGDFAHLLDLSPALSTLRESWTRKLALARDRFLTRQVFAKRAFWREKLNAERALAAWQAEPPNDDAVPGHQRLRDHRAGALAWGSRAHGHRTVYAPDAIARNLDAFGSIVERTRARGIPILFVRFPVHAAYLRAAPPEFEAAFQRVHARARALAPEAEVVDLSREPHFADDEFFDDDHLNERGAARLTDILSARVEAMLARQPAASR